MGNLPKLNPNILLTEICNQNCDYCFAKRRMETAEKKEMSFGDLAKTADFLKKNGISEIRLMGGEPTLHSEFKKIIDFILFQGLTVRVFTNGLFSEELAIWLAKKSSLIAYTVNLATPSLQSESGKTAVVRNLKILKNSEIWISLTINNLGFDCKGAIEIIKECGVKIARLGVANGLIGNLRWLRPEQFCDFGSLIFFLIGELKKAGITKIELNCGFTPCMFQGRLEYILKEVGNISWGCGGKKSAFDVATDLSAFPCFILGNLKIKTIFDFRSLKSANKFIKNSTRRVLRSHLSFPEYCKECLHFKKGDCSGPCYSYNMSNSGFFYSKIIYKLLYVFRDWL